MLLNLLPSPVLSIGLTGHRDVGMTGATAESVEHTIGDVVAALSQALAVVVARDSFYFSPDKPTMRLVTTGAEGAELLGIRAARSRGVEIFTIMPLAWEDYRHDFTGAAATEAAEIFGGAALVLELPGQRDEGPRAYERANEAILSNVDLLLAIWDGGREPGRTGADDMVQGAIERGIPVIVIAPEAPAIATIMELPSRDHLDPPPASDLGRRPLPTDLAPLLGDVMSPPPQRVQRQALHDMLDESATAGTWRFEYPLLVQAFGGRRKALPPDAPTPPRLAVERGPELDRLDRAQTLIDSLAVRYGSLFRSSSVAQYLVVIIGIWISGVVGFLFPSLAGISIAVQLISNALILADAALRLRRRWEERWLDYRIVAEQLRWLRFRRLFGLGTVTRQQYDFRRKPSWTDWYLRRMAAAAGPPRGTIDQASVSAAAAYLTGTEIPSQIKYHRSTFRQLGLVERRLQYAAQFTLVAAVCLALSLGIAAVHAGGLAAVGWKPLAIVLLTALPATMTSLNGLRVNADLSRLVERSAETVARLFRLRRLMLVASDDYDGVVAKMQRLASVMANELTEWRFVIESRRSRGNSLRGKMQKRRTLLRRIARRQ